MRSLRRPSRSLAIVAAVAVAAVVAVGPVARPSAAATLIPLTPGPARSDPHYYSAVQEAGRLATDTPLPPGSTPLLSLGPPPLTGSFDRPATSHLVDRSRLWVLPMSMKNAFDWLNAHRPVGLIRSGSFGSIGSLVGIGAPGSVAGFDWSAPDTAAYLEATLEEAVTPDGSTRSIVRSDGTDIWVSSAPTPDQARGKRVRVTMRSGCPARLAGDTDVTNSLPVLRRHLLPTQTPMAALICAYTQRRSGAIALTHHVRLQQPAARSLAASINRIDVGYIGDMIQPGCPLGRGYAEILVFGYDTGASVDLWYDTSGCSSLDNGFISAQADGNPPFYEGFMPAVARLVG